MARTGDARVKDLVESAAAALESGQWEQALIGASDALALDDTNKAALEVMSAARSLAVTVSGVGAAVGSPLGAAVGAPEGFAAVGVAAPVGVAVLDPTPPIPDPPPGALYYSVGPADMHPGSSYTEWDTNYFVFSKGQMAAGVHLPHGATIWGWRAYTGRGVWGFTTSVNVSLGANRHETSNGFLLGSADAVYPPGASGERELSHLQGPAGSIVNNRYWSYDLRVTFDVSAVPSNLNVRPWQTSPYFRGATVVYLP